jgi:hypothetical protein
MSEQIQFDGIERDRNSIELIDDYLQILRGTNLSEYDDARGMLDDILYDNIIGYSSVASSTAYAAHALEAFKLKDTQDNLEMFDSMRKFAAAHVVRGMIQGGKIPIEQFETIVSLVVRTIAEIDGNLHPTRTHKAWVLDEILDVWRFERGHKGSPVTARRAAEAFKYVGRPRAYGHMMTVVARREKKLSSY